MCQMSRFDSRNRVEGGSYGGEEYGDGNYEERALIHSFSDEAWEEFRSMTFEVRRLRRAYMLHVECVSPPHQESAVAEFARRLRELSPRTVALACFWLVPGLSDQTDPTRLLIPDWSKYVRRIPKDQIVELLTSPDPGRIDADLSLELQREDYLGYGPYFRDFLRYVVSHCDYWFTEEEFAEIKPRFNASAREAWRIWRSFGNWNTNGG